MFWANIIILFNFLDAKFLQRRMLAAKTKKEALFLFRNKASFFVSNGQYALNIRQNWKMIQQS